MKRNNGRSVPNLTTSKPSSDTENKDPSGQWALAMPTDPYHLKWNELMEAQYHWAFAKFTVRIEMQTEDESDPHDVWTWEIDDETMKLQIVSRIMANMKLIQQGATADREIKELDKQREQEERQ